MVRLSSRALALILLLLSSLMLQAQTSTDDAAPDEGPPIVRERTIYVPFEKLAEIFEKAGRGSFLSYEQLNELLAIVRAATTTGAAPLEATVEGGVYRGTVDGQRVRFDVTFEVETYRGRWQRVDLPFQGVALESVNTPDEVTLTARPEGGYSLWVERPGRHSVELRFTVPIVESPGKKAIAFQFPRLVSSRLELTLPDADAQIEVAGDPAQSTEAVEGGQRLTVFLGSNTQVGVNWSPPPGRAVDAGAVVIAEQTIFAHLRERVLELRVRVQYSVERGEAREFRVTLPPDTQLISVEGENIREWAPEGNELRVSLHTSVRDDYRLEFTTERLLDAVPERLALPVPRVQNVLRETGWLIFTYDEGLRVRPESTENLSQLDRQQIPTEGDRVLGYSYLAQPIAWTATIERITPRIEAATNSVVVLGEQEDLWIGDLRYAIRRAGVFSVRFRIPLGWTVLQVGAPDVVDEFLVAEVGETDAREQEVTVNLKEKATGELTLPFRASRDGSARLGAGESRDLSLAPPYLPDVERVRGLFGVSAPRQVDTVTRDRVGLVDAEPAELERSGIAGRVPSGSSVPRVFRFRTQPSRVTLRLTGKQTGLEVVAQHLVEVADSELRFTHWLDYDILYAATDRVAFFAPTALDDVLQIETQQRTEIQRRAVAGGLTRWEIQLQPAVLGAVTVKVTHSRPLTGMVAGRGESFDVPLIRPDQAQSEVGFVAVRKEGNLEIAITGGEWESIEPVSLPDRLRRGKIYRALRFFGGSPRLVLGLTRYDYQPLAQTTVPLIHLKSLLSREQRIKTRATIFLKNAGRQFLELEFPSEARIYSLTVAGERQAPKRRADGVTLIDIPPSLDAEGTFPVVVVYETALSGDGDPLALWGALQLETPTLGGEIPVGRIEMDLYLPPEFRYYGWSGSLDPRGRVGEDEQVSWWARFKSLLGGDEAQASPDDASGAWVRAPADLELPTRGYHHQPLETLGGVGSATFSFVDERLFWTIDAAIFLIAFALAWIVVRRRPASAPLIALAAIALVGASLSIGVTREMMLSALVAVGLAYLLVLFRHAGGAWAQRREARLAMAPDPFLEDAPTPRAPGRKKPKLGKKRRVGKRGRDDSDSDETDEDDAADPDATDSDSTNSDDEKGAKHD